MSKQTYSFDFKYSQIDEQYSELEIKMFPSKKSQKKVDKYLLVILDTSGSMYGSKINSCKQTLNELISYCQTTLDNSKIDLIDFNSNAKIINLFEMNLKDQFEIIKNINAGGGTEMTPVFEKTKQILLQRKKENGVKDICIIFLTDGQPNENKQEIQQLSQQLKQFLSKNFQSADVHSLGYGKDHQPEVCLALTESSLGLGTFQYVESVDQTSQCIDSIAGSLGDKTKKTDLLLSNGEQIILRPLLDQSKNFYKVSQIFDQGDLNEYLQGAKLKISKKKGDLIYNLENLEQIVNQDQGQKLLKAKFQKYNQYLQQITKQISNQDQQLNVKEINQQLSKYKVDVFQLKRSIFKFEEEEQIKFKSQYEDLMEYMQKITTILVDFSNKNISSETIAQINSMAYRDTVKQNLSKKLDKRILQNAQKTDQIMDKVKNIQYDQQALEQKYQDKVSEYGNCYVSQLNILETIQDKNCFCITFDIEKSQVAINDPGRIRILQINPTYISSSSLFDCIKYHLSLDQLAFGSFQPQQQEANSQMQGQANERIRAAMPIYIFQEHWEIAKNLMIPILGWVTTQNTNGFDVQQLRTLPFSLLYKAYLDKDKSEFSLRMFNDLKQTCQAILKDDPDFNNHLLNIANNYLSDGVLRTSQNVMNTETFLKQLLFLQLENTINLDQEYIFNILIYAFEEDIRRRIKKDSWNQNQGFLKLIQLMNVDEKNILKQLDSFFIKQSNNQLEIKLTQEVEDLIKVDFDQQFQPIVQLQELFEQISKQYQKWIKLFCPTKQLKQLQDLNIKSHSQAVILYYQSKIHTQNNQRIEAFQNKTYINFQNDQECKQKIKQLIVNRIWNTFKQAYVKKNVEPIVSYQQLNELALSDNMNQFEQIISKQKFFDLKCLQILLSIFRKQKCNLVFEKLNYILYKDQLKFQKKPLKRFTRKLFAKYKNDYKYEEWKKLWYKPKKINIK